MLALTGVDRLRWRLLALAHTCGLATRCASHAALLLGQRLPSLLFGVTLFQALRTLGRCVLRTLELLAGQLEQFCLLP